MRVVLQKADIDTCLTGVLLGVLRAEDVTVRAGGATPDELADPSTVCIEAGGAGDVAHGNFDHHGLGAPADPACVQAARAAGVSDPCMLRLVDYVAAVDLGRLPRDYRTAFPMLSNLFSGLLLCTAYPERQFREGMQLLELVHREQIDPFGTIPARAEWRPFIEAKRRAQAALVADLVSARLFRTRSGATAGVVSTGAPGALGALYELGCRYAIAVSDGAYPMSVRPRRKMTIGGRDGAAVGHLLTHLNELEAGWGGPSHGTIIGSPRSGSGISPRAICKLIHELC